MVAESVITKFPRCRIVAIHRPIDDCVDSLFNAMTWGKDVDFGDVTKDKLLAQMRNTSKGIQHMLNSVDSKRKMVVGYDDLDCDGTIRAIFEFCAPSMTIPKQRIQMLQDLRVTQIFSKVLTRHPDQPFRKLIESHESILEVSTA
jgi:hypothetical protein